MTTTHFSNPWLTLNYLNQRCKWQQLDVKPSNRNTIGIKAMMEKITLVSSTLVELF